jgi:hypothetical protein
MFADADGKALVDAINAKLTASGKKFVDLELPPTKNSLNRRPADEEAQVGSDKTVWRRVKTWMKDPCVFSDDGVSVDDVDQGGLGDCWLCAGIASIATRPEIVESMYVLSRILTHSHAVFVNIMNLRVPGVTVPYANHYTTPLIQ